MQTLFVDIKKTNQKELIRQALDNSKLKWPAFFSFLGVSRSMLSLYYRQKCDLPKNRLEQMVNAGWLPASTLEKTDFIHLKQTPFKQIIKPAISEKLAYFLGVLYGDGCISTKFSVNVTCNAILERQFIFETIKPLFRELFGLEASIKYSKRNGITCYTYCKQLWEFLRDDYGFPVGEKKNKMRIPPQIHQNPEFQKAFLRGLFDTDGGYFRHHQKSAMLQFCSYSPDFMKEVSELLIHLGFKNSVSGTNLYICDKRLIEQFFDEIKPANPRLTKKFEIYQKTGIVPLQREMPESQNLILQARSI